MTLPQTIQQPPLPEPVRRRARRGAWLLPSLWGTLAMFMLVGTLVIIGLPTVERTGPAQDPETATAAAPSASSRDMTRLATEIGRLQVERERLIARIEVLERQFSGLSATLSRLEDQRVPIITGTIPAPAATTGAAAGSATTTRSPAIIDSGNAAIPDGPARRISFAVDLGGAPSVDRLKARWAALKDIHGQQLAKLEPKVALGRSRDGDVELRLIAGPFQNAESAVRACASIRTGDGGCAPVPFDGEPLPAF